MATKSTGQRVTDLESWAFRTGSDLADIKETLGELPATVREEVMVYTSPMFEEIMNRMATKEDLSALTARVDGLETRVGSLEVKVDRLETKVDDLAARMTSMEGRMGSMENRMGSMEGKIDLILAKLG
ncbi:DUF2730 family protein [Streptosporangium carneum]|uniref:DUF2730 family protein n=1 Tax=Streptosporangium carneum TaxID=47481 RepID=UPI0022F2F32E|nr:DUF2730 family protein [Streptosporangium carneum]